jgi:hypothetical protein
MNKLRLLQTARPDASADTFENYVNHFKKILYDKLKISVEQEQSNQAALEQITATEKKVFISFYM